MSRKKYSMQLRAHGRQLSRLDYHCFSCHHSLSLILRCGCVWKKEGEMSYGIVSIMIPHYFNERKCQSFNSFLCVFQIFLFHLPAQAFACVFDTQQSHTKSNLAYGYKAHALYLNCQGADADCMVTGVCYLNYLCLIQHYVVQ